MKKKLRFGIIGFGHFGKHYARLFKNHPEAELAGVANTAQEAEIIFRSPGIDGVIIVTPALSHFALASKALEARKHVLLEKPMVANLRESYQLEKKVQKSKKVFLLGHQYLYNDYIRHIKRALEKNMLGQVKYVFMENVYYGPIRKGISCFWETAGHEFSILDYLFGPLAIAQVSGCSAPMTQKKQDDFTAVSIKLKNGMLISMVISWFMPKKARSMTIVGTKGMALFDDVETKDKLRFFPNPYPKTMRGSSHFFPDRGRAGYAPRIRAQEPLSHELNHFIDCVKNNKIPLTDIKHGLRITKLLHIISSKL